MRVGYPLIFRALWSFFLVFGKFKKAKKLRQQRPKIVLRFLAFTDPLFEGFFARFARETTTVESEKLVPTPVSGRVKSVFFAFAKNG